MSDDIKFACEKCGQSVSVASVHAGASLHCPGCGGPLTVPTGAPGSGAGSSGTGGITFNGDAANSEHKSGELVVKRYRLERILGRGGMGVVWLANDEQLGEPVALKFVPPEIRSDKDALKDLRRETQKSRKLSHPNIIRIHDLTQSEDTAPFISMEFVAGETMSSLRGKQPNGLFSWETLRPLVTQLCAALDYAHSQGIVHRDLKPANLMVTESGQVKLADFGIAATISDTMGRVSLDNLSSGTPTYMSPQQIEGFPPSARDDVYALGATLYDLLTSKPPFFRGKIIHQVLNVTPVTPEERLKELGLTNAIPPEVSAAIMACLVKESDQRLSSVAAVAQALGLPTGGLASSSAVSVGTASQPPAAEPPMEAAPEPAAQNRRTMYWMAAAAGCVLVLAGLLVALNNKKSQTAPTTSATSSTPSATAKPAGAASTFVAATTETPFANSPSNEKWVDGLAAYWEGDQKNDGKLVLRNGKTVAPKSCVQFPPRTLPMRDQAVRVAVEGQIIGTTLIVRESRDRKYKFHNYVVKFGGSGSFDFNNGSEVTGGGYSSEGRIAAPKGFDINSLHTMELRAIGNTFTFWCDGKVLLTGPIDSNLTSGLPGVYLPSGAVVRRLEYANLDAQAPSPSPAPVPAAPSTAVAGKTVQLLPLVDVKRDAIDGEWSVTPDGLVQKYNGKLARLEFNYAPTPEYDFETEFTVQEGGTGDVSQILAVPGHWFLWRTLPPGAIGPDVDGLKPGDPKRTEGMGQNMTRLRAGQRCRSVVEVREVASSASAPATVVAATKDAPFVNSLGMKFVPVPITGGPTDKQRVLFSIWETRVQDYEDFAKETKRDWPKPEFGQGPTHPAVNVSWDNAVAFCVWLTERELKAGRIGANERYRLPSDHEWSCAVGIGDREDITKQPADKKGGVPGVYPWGTQWPPPPGVGNLAGEEVKPVLAERKKDFQFGALNGYRDDFINTAPVGSFAPNRHGLFDLSGNTWEWCDDWFWADEKQRWRVLRGGDWNSCTNPRNLASDYRHANTTGSSWPSSGFRCVLASASAMMPAATPARKSPAERHKFVDEEVARLKKEPASVPIQLAKLEKLAADYPEVPSRALHNELRHLYGNPAIKNAKKEMEQADIMLKIAPMDKYTMHLLGGGGSDSATNVPKLQTILNAADSYGFIHLQAACSLQIGDALRLNEKNAQARPYYERVLKLNGIQGTSYETIAKQRLGK